MKRCSCCKEEKDEGEFQRNRSLKDGLQDQCKTCRRETDQKSYANRSEEQKARYREQDRQAALRNIDLIYQYLLEHPCVDCGEADPVVLEFDHISGEKLGDVANFVRSGRRWETIQEEIAKCEVRCANCHRRITAQRSGRRKYILSLDNRPT
jgi:hypothetical protein